MGRFRRDRYDSNFLAFGIEMFRVTIGLRKTSGAWRFSYIGADGDRLS